MTIEKKLEELKEKAKAAELREGKQRIEKQHRLEGLLLWRE